jgi:hypothetical protein
MGKRAPASPGHRFGVARLRLGFEPDELLVALEVVDVEYSIEVVDFVFQRLGEQPVGM